MNHNEKKYDLSRLLLNFGKKGKTAQLNGLLTGHGLRGMVDGRDYYAGAIVFPFLASFNYKSFGLEKSCDLTRMNVQLTDNVDKVLVHHKEVQCVKGEL